MRFSAYGNNSIRTRMEREGKLLRIALNVFNLLIEYFVNILLLKLSAQLIIILSLSLFIECS